MKQFSLSLLLGLALVSNVGAVEKKLSSLEIEVLLPSIVAVSDTTRQSFSAAGATTYTDRGRDSYGTWRTDKDQYCSQWPPARNWACYDVLRDEENQTLIWVDGQGHRTVNLILKK